MSEVTKKWYSFDEIHDSVLESLSKGIRKGYKVGFRCMEDLYSARFGGTTFKYGPPSSGKTRIHFNDLIAMTRHYGAINVIYSPETGYKEDVMRLICGIMARKRFWDMTKAEFTEVYKIASRFFYIIDDFDVTYKDIFAQAYDIQKVTGKKVFSITADPHNMVAEHPEILDGATQRDLKLRATLKYIRKTAAKMDLHAHIINHTRDMQPVQMEYSDGTKKFTLPPASGSDLLDGQEWHRQGEMMLSYWRPRVYYDTNGYPVTAMIDGLPLEANAVFVNMNKVKPEEYGNWGSAKLFYDKEAQSYYEMNQLLKQYAWEYKGV